MKDANKTWLKILLLTSIIINIHASNTDALIYKALYHKSRSEILEYRHTLVKAITQSDKNSSIAKRLYGNDFVYTGKLKEYLSVDSFDDINFVESSEDKSIFPSIPLNYVENGYNVSLTAFDINITKKKELINSSSEYFLLPILPIFTPEYIVFSRFDSNSGNLGYPVLIKSYENETCLTYKNQYNINDIFLSKDKDFLISYTPNQINITALKENFDELKSIQIDTFVDGVTYLKNGVLAYWYNNEISIIQMYRNQYEKIAILYNIKEINSLFFNQKNNELMVKGEHSFAKWDIARIFEEKNLREIELNEKERLAIYIGLPRLRGEHDREIVLNDSQNGLYVEQDRVIVFDTKSKKKLLSLKHNLLNNQMEKHSRENTFAQLSADKKNVLSWSCFKGRDLPEGCFCKLYLTDIESRINLIEKNDGCIAKAGFSEKDDGVYVHYHKEMHIISQHNQNGDDIYMEVDEHGQGLYVHYDKHHKGFYLEADNMSYNYNESNDDIYVTYNKNSTNSVTDIPHP